MTCEFCGKIVRDSPCDKWQNARGCPNLEAWIVSEAKKIEKAQKESRK